MKFIEGFFQKDYWHIVKRYDEESAILSQERHDAVEERMDYLEKQKEELEEKIENLEAKLASVRLEMSVIMDHHYDNETLNVSDV